MKPTNRLELNTAEQFLMSRLKDVVLLEKSMKAVRQKYDGFWERICQVAYPEMKYRSIHASDRSAQVGLGKQSWTSAYDGWPSGLYLWAIGFENLSNADANPPQVGVWVKPPKSIRADLREIRERIRQRIQTAVGTTVEEPRNSDISFWCDLPESRRELLEALTNNNGLRFTRIMVAHIRSLAPVIPEIDRIFAGSKSRSK